MLGWLLDGFEQYIVGLRFRRLERYVIRLRRRIARLKTMQKEMTGAEAEAARAELEELWQTLAGCEKDAQQAFLDCKLNRINRLKGEDRRNELQREITKQRDMVSTWERRGANAKASGDAVLEQAASVRRDMYKRFLETLEEQE